MGKAKKPKASWKSNVKPAGEPRSTRSCPTTRSHVEPQLCKAPRKSVSSGASNLNLQADQEDDPLQDKTVQKSDDENKNVSETSQYQTLKRKMDSSVSESLSEEQPVEVKQKKPKKRKKDYPPIIKISRQKRRYKSSGKSKGTQKDELDERDHHVSGSKILDCCEKDLSSCQNITGDTSSNHSKRTSDECEKTDIQPDLTEFSVQSVAHDQSVRDSELLEDTIILSSLPDESSIEVKVDHILEITTTSTSNMVGTTDEFCTETAPASESSVQCMENIERQQQIESTSMLSNEEKAVDFSVQKIVENAEQPIEAANKLGFEDRAVCFPNTEDVDHALRRIDSANKIHEKNEAIDFSRKTDVCNTMQQTESKNKPNDKNEAVDFSNKKDVNKAAHQIEASNNLENQDNNNIDDVHESSEKENTSNNALQLQEVHDCDVTQVNNPALKQLFTKDVDCPVPQESGLDGIESEDSLNREIPLIKNVDNITEESMVLDNIVNENLVMSEQDLLQEMTVLIGGSDQSTLKNSDVENIIISNNNYCDGKKSFEAVSSFEVVSSTENDVSMQNQVDGKVATQCMEEIFHEPDENDTRKSILPKKIKEASKNVDLDDNLKQNNVLTSKKLIEIKTKHKNATRSLKKTPRRPVKSPPLNQYVYNENDELSCRVCLQKLDAVKFHTKSFDHGLDEDRAILDPHLQLFNGNEKEITQEDWRASNKVTNFSIYCKNGHLCSIDSGMIEQGMELFFSGYIKPVFSDDSLLEGGVPGKDFGPIVHWWITGFDLGEQPILGLTTEIGDYFLMEPSEEYSLLMQPLLGKIFLGKAVIECLIYDPHASYEDLMSKLQNETRLHVTEDILLDQARFICDQVVSFDETAKPGEPLLVVAPCIRRLIDLAGIKFSKQENPCPRMIEEQKDPSGRNVTTHGRSLASTFSDELIDRLLPLESSVEPSIVPKKGRCKVCERCCRQPCQSCDACVMKKLDECVQRRCFYYEIQEANDEDWRNSFDHSQLKVKSSIAVYKDTIQNFQCFESKLSWIDPPLGTDKNGDVYYESVTVDDVKISSGDCVTVRSINRGIPAQVMRIAYMWQNSAGVAQFHGNYLWSGRDTVLGKFATKRELFSINNCQNLPLVSVVDRVHVDLRSLPKCWDELVIDESATTLFCHKSYDPKSGCFTDIALNESDNSSSKSESPLRFCRICEMDLKKYDFYSPRPFGPIDESDGKVKYRGLKYKGEAYRTGTAVYLKPKSIYFKYPMFEKPRSTVRKTVDESVYPEYFRKMVQPKTNLQLETSAPLDIGYIKEIVMSSNKLSLRVKKLYRPENTHRLPRVNKTFDFNMLFWSHEECTIPFEYVIGKCYLTHENNVDDVGDWSRRGPDRFYFSQVYEEKQLFSVDSDRYLDAGEAHEIPRDVIGMTKLRTLDLFAGCGGLSCGLQQAGVADTCWAIESDAAAASTYRLNSPQTAVFVEDCDTFLKRVLKGETKLDFQALPSRGEVQLLCTTLPCKSLRAINSVSTFKSSCIATFVSFCDYYRPLLFVIEADERLVKKSSLLKLTLACFVNMGYQVSFDLMQVGCYGAPQNCRRSVILGAAPGQKLPRHPRPLHSLPKTLYASGVVVGGKKYTRPSDWVDFAPYRGVSIQDAIEDLQIMKTNSPEDYCGEPVTCYQRMMRSGMLEPTLSDHVWKDLDPLVQSRIARIPHTKHSNWCDLPNIQIKLEDGRVANKLKYPYEIQTPTGMRRGVCRCSEGKKCEARDKQDGCLIPWYLAHSADDRNEHWATLYARMAWDELSSGGMTNPELLGEQGPVLHPSQNRIVSVRECARLQGFGDDFILDKNLSMHQKYQLIGNATSPLFALAIGQEIARSLIP